MAGFLSDDLINRARQANIKVDSAAEDDGFLPESVKNVGKRIAAGAYELKGAAHGALGATAHALGNDEGAEIGLEKAQRDFGVAEDFRPEGDVVFKDIDFSKPSAIGETASFIFQQMQAEIPSLAVGALTGGASYVAGAAGKNVAKGLTKEAIEKKIKQKTSDLVSNGVAEKAAREMAAKSVESQARKRATKVAGAVGFGATGIAESTGQTFVEVEEESGELHGGASLIAGAAVGVIDAFPVFKFLDNIVGGKEVKKSIIKRVGEISKKTGADVLREGGTEAIQSIIQQASVEIIQNKPDDMSHADWMELAKEGLKSVDKMDVLAEALVGSGMGSTSVAGHATSQPKVDENDQIILATEEKIDSMELSEVESSIQHVEQSVTKNIELLKAQAIRAYESGDDSAITTFKKRNTELRTKLGELRAKADNRADQEAEYESATSPEEGGNEKQEKKTNPHAPATIEYEAYEKIRSGDTDIDFDDDSPAGIRQAAIPQGNAQRDAVRRAESEVQSTTRALEDAKHDEAKATTKVASKDDSAKAKDEARKVEHRQKVLDAQKAQTEANRKLEDEKAKSQQLREDTDRRIEASNATGKQYRNYPAAEQRRRKLKLEDSHDIVQADNGEYAIVSKESSNNDQHDKPPSQDEHGTRPGNPSTTGRQAAGNQDAQQSTQSDSRSQSDADDVSQAGERGEILAGNRSSDAEASTASTEASRTESKSPLQSESAVSKPVKKLIRGLGKRDEKGKGVGPAMRLVRDAKTSDLKAARDDLNKKPSNEFNDRALNRVQQELERRKLNKQTSDRERSQAKRDETKKAEQQKLNDAVKAEKARVAAEEAKLSPEERTAKREKAKREYAESIQRDKERMAREQKERNEKQARAAKNREKRIAEGKQVQPTLAQFIANYGGLDIDFLKKRFNLDPKNMNPALRTASGAAKPLWKKNGKIKEIDDLQEMMMEDGVWNHLFAGNTSVENADQNHLLFDELLDSMLNGGEDFYQEGDKEVRDRLASNTDDEAYQAEIEAERNAQWGAYSDAAEPTDDFTSEEVAEVAITLQDVESGADPLVGAEADEYWAAIAEEEKQERFAIAGARARAENKAKRDGTEFVNPYPSKAYDYRKLDRKKRQLETQRRTVASLEKRGKNKPAYRKAVTQLRKLEAQIDGAERGRVAATVSATAQPEKLTELETLQRERAELLRKNAWEDRRLAPLLDTVNRKIDAATISAGQANSNVTGKTQEGNQGAGRGSGPDKSKSRTEEEILKSYTNAEIVAKERAEAEKRRNDSLEETAPSPDEFVLSGSDREADVLAAHGQEGFDLSNFKRVIHGSKGKKFSAKAFNAIVDRYRAKYPNQTLVVSDTPAGLPPKLRRYWQSQGSPEVDGLFDTSTGKIHLFRDGIKSGLALERILMHEGQHKGGRLAYGRNIDAKYLELSKLVDSIGGIDQYVKDHKLDFDVSAYRGDVQGSSDATQAIYLMDELLAHMAETRNTKWAKVNAMANEVIAMVRDFLRRKGMNFHASLPQDELMLALRDSRKALAQTTMPTTLEGTPVFHRKISNTWELQSHLDDPQQGHFETGVPVKFNYIHNPDSFTKKEGKPKKGDQFNRDTEPAGRFITHIERPRKEIPPGYVQGTLDLKNPLVIDGKGGTGWKPELSKAYGGLTGKKLSKALIRDGFDAIITLDHTGRQPYVSETVELQTFDESKAMFSRAKDRQKSSDEYYSDKIPGWEHEDDAGTDLEELMDIMERNGKRKMKYALKNAGGKKEGANLMQRVREGDRRTLNMFISKDAHDTAPARITYYNETGFLSDEKHNSIDEAFEHAVRGGFVEKPDVSLNEMALQKGFSMFSRSKKKGIDHLVTMHNLTQDNIRHANKMGGIAPPSLAVTKADNEFTSFGEVSLIADPSILDDPDARTYNADIYTPRYPSVEYESDEKKTEKAMEGFRFSNTWDVIRNIEDGGIKKLKYNEEIRADYIDKNVKKVPDFTVKNENKDEDMWWVKWAGKDRNQLENDEEFTALLRMHHADRVKKARAFDTPENIEKYKKIQLKKAFKEDGAIDWSSKINKKLARAIAFYTPKPVKAEIDKHAQRKWVREQFLKNRKHEENLSKWLKKTFEPTIKKERIRKGYTPSGNRRYIPHTLNNVVKEMTAKVQGGEGFSGMGHIRSGAASRFRSAKETAQYRDQIVENIDEAKEQMTERFNDLAMSLHPYYKYSADRDDHRYHSAVEENLYEKAMKGIRTGKMVDFSRVPKDVMTEVEEFLFDLRDMPTEYFESKVQRAMSFSEFTGAVVPKDTAQDVMDILEGAGLKVVKYSDTAKTKSRTALIKKEFPEALFRRSRTHTNVVGQTKSMLGHHSDSARYYLQDSLINLKRMQEDLTNVGLHIDDDSDAYEKAGIWEGVAGDRLAEFEDTHITPLRELIAESDHSFEDIGMYLLAQSAALDSDANSIAALQKFTTKSPDSILAKYKKDTPMQEIAQIVNDLRDERIDQLLDDGLITQTDADDWQKTNRYFVPLKKHETDDNLPSRGAGFSVGGSELRYSGKEISVNLDEILPTILGQNQASIVRAEKNKVTSALLKFAETNPDDSIWTIKNKGDDDYGNANTDESVVAAKIDGVEKHIVMNKNNRAAMNIARAMKKMDARDMNMVMRMLAQLNKFLSTMTTTVSPVFMLVNPIRDVQTAAYNLQSTELEGQAGTVIKNWEKARKAIWRVERGKAPRGDYDKHYQEFVAHGGKTGWVDAHSSIQTFTNQLQKDVDRIKNGKKPTTWTMNKARDTFKWIEDANVMFENAIRLSAYVEARKSGMTEQKAASLAKELTVNFNRKGVYGQHANALYLFYNAAVQGNVRMIQGLATSKKIQGMAAATVGISSTLHVMNALMSGEDEDEENLYLSIPSYVKERNMIFMLPGFKEPVLKVPVPYGFNVFHVMGHAFGNVALRAAGVRMNNTAMQDVMEIGSAFVGSFSPVGFSTTLQNISPTVTDPLVQIAENKNFAGIPLKPKQSPWGVQKPNSEQHYGSVSGISEKLAKGANKLTGGNEVRPGAVSLSPEWIDLVYETYGGGLGRFVRDIVDIGVTGITEQKVEKNRVPFARHFTGHDYQRGVQSRYYDRLPIVQRSAKELKTLKGAQLTKAKQRPETALIAIEKATSKRIRSLRRTRNKLRKQGRDLEAIETQIRREMIKFNKAYRRIMIEA